MRTLAISMMRHEQTGFPIVLLLLPLLLLRSSSSSSSTTTYSFNTATDAMARCRQIFTPSFLCLCLVHSASGAASSRQIVTKRTSRGLVEQDAWFSHCTVIEVLSTSLRFAHARTARCWVPLKHLSAGSGSQKA